LNNANAGRNHHQCRGGMNSKDRESKDQRYIRSLISEGEHRELDFKFEISDARKIARTLSAFSNTSGGRLLIGVKDNGRISGVRSDEEYYMVESAAMLYCKPEVRFESRSHLIEGKSVLEIYIPPVEKKPVYARDTDNRWMAYLRVEDQNVLASVVQLEVWKAEGTSAGDLIEFTRRESILLGYLQREPGSSLQKIQLDTGFRRKELVPLITKLIRFDVVEIYISEGISVFRLKEKPGSAGINQESNPGSSRG
jgi:hypothetical protein